MKRVLCVWFPNWPVQRLRGERPERDVFVRLPTVARVSALRTVNRNAAQMQQPRAASFRRADRVSRSVRTSTSRQYVRVNSRSPNSSRARWRASSRLSPAATRSFTRMSM